MAVLTLRNVLPELFQNELDKKFVYDDLGLIPYRGSNRYSSHATLNLQYDLAELSPSQGLCINELTRTAFAGDVDLIKGGRKGLMSDPAKPAMLATDKDRYVDMIESVGLDLIQVNKTLQEAFKQYKKSGFCFVRYKEETLAGAKKITLKAMDSRNCMRKYRKRKSDPFQVFVMPRMITHYSDQYMFFSHIEDKRFEIIPMYPFFKKRKNSRETMFMFKKGNMVYGLPDSIETIRDQWIEYALTELSCKISGTEYTAMKLWIYKDLKPSSDTAKNRAKFMKLAGQLEKVMTNSGDKAKSMVFTKVPNNVELDIEDLQFSRDSEWYKTNLDKACNNIYAAHGVYKQLTGAEQAKANIGGNIIGDLMTVYDYKVIATHQRDMANFFMNISNTIAEFSGEEDMKNVKIVFPRTIDEIKTNLSGSKNLTDEIGSIIE